MSKKFYNKHLLIFSLILIVYYFLSTQLSYDSFFVGDDYTMLSFNDTNFLKTLLFTDSWWRPFKNIFYNYFNLNFYLNAFLIVKIKIFIHLFNSTIIYFYFLKYSKDNFISILLATLFLTHQSGVMAVISVDTVGQQFCTLFGILSFISIKSFCDSQKNRYLFLSVFLMFLSLLSKENGVSFIFINCLVLIFFNSGKKIFDLKNQFSKNILPLILILLILLIFLYLRSLLNASWSPNFGNERYSINLVYVLKNFIQYNVSILSPLDNTFIYLLLKNLDNLNLYLIIIISFIIFIYYILFKNIIIDQQKILFFIIFICSSLPVILLSHISELYTYHSIFFFSLLLLVCLKRKNNFEFFKKIFLCLFVLISLMSTIIKLNNNNNNSILSKKLYNYFDSIKNNQNLTSKLYFIENKDLFNKYSIFKINSLEFLVPRFYIRDNLKFDYIPIRENNKNFFSEGDTFRTNVGDGRGLQPIPKDILFDPNFTLIYLDVPKNRMNLRQIIHYYLFQNQCILFISPITKIDKKLCKNSS